MQTTSSLWKEIFSKEHTVEYKAVIGDNSYLSDSLIGAFITRALFEDVQSVGKCGSAQLDLDLWGASNIPRNAEIKIYVRLVSGDTASEWLPQGTFYIDTRSVSGEITTIHGYDAMLKAEQTFLAEGDTGEWPRTQQAVVNAICARMGVELDSRTVINSTYMVEYPNDYTMREILGYIAAAHGGCWIITPAGKLRLVTLGGLPAETNYLVDEYGNTITMGGVKILV